MSDQFRITLAQLNPTVGDLPGNAAKALDAWRQGKYEGANGGAARDVHHRLPGAGPRPMKRCLLDAVLTRSRPGRRNCADGPAIDIGGPAPEGVKLLNSYFILKGGQIAARVAKAHPAQL